MAIEKTSRGGARLNAGRKPKTTGSKVVTVSFCCTPEQKEKIAAAAAAAGLNKSDYILSKLF